ncbi:MAG: hypothetical protein R2877_01630 [Bdellovibrionota bacterium]
MTILTVLGILFAYPTQAMPKYWDEYSGMEREEMLTRTTLEQAHKDFAGIAAGMCRPFFRIWDMMSLGLPVNTEFEPMASRKSLNMSSVPEPFTKMSFPKSVI